MYFYSIACILFIAATGLSSHRFEVDLLPFLLIIGCVVGVDRVGRLQGSRRIVAVTVFVVFLLYSLVANIALAIQGPYDQFVQGRPDKYVQLAKWFSPVEQFRPLLDPHLQVGAYFDFPEYCPAFRLPLISAGEFGSRYVLKSECLDTHGVRLIAETAPGSQNVRTVDIPLNQPGLHHVAIEFTPADHIMTVRWDERIVLQQPLSSLVTSRSQVRLGWDPTFGDQRVFNRRIVVFEKPRL